MIHDRCDMNETVPVTANPIAAAPAAGNRPAPQMTSSTIGGTVASASKRPRNLPESCGSQWKQTMTPAARPPSWEFLSRVGAAPGFNRSPSSRGGTGTVALRHLRTPAQPDRGFWTGIWADNAKLWHVERPVAAAAEAVRAPAPSANTTGARQTPPFKDDRPRPRTIPAGLGHKLRPYHSSTS